MGVCSRDITVEILSPSTSSIKVRPSNGPQFALRLCLICRTLTFQLLYHFYCSLIVRVVLQNLLQVGSGLCIIALMVIAHA